MGMARESCSNPARCARCGNNLLVWSLACSLFLAVLKLWGGIASGSSGLLADGLESVACLVGSLAIMGSLILSQKRRDHAYPYGYGKFEYVVALIVFCLLFALGFSIFMNSFLTIVRREWSVPGVWSLPIAAASIFLNRMMYAYCDCAGKKQNSIGLVANGLQHKADMYSSVAVFAGILFSQVGPTAAIADPLAALAVGVLIMFDAYEHWNANVQVLLDKDPDPGFRMTIRDSVANTLPGHEPRYVNVKRTGEKYWIGIGTDFSDCESVCAMELQQSRIRTLIQYRLPLVEKVDFFFEIPQ